MGVATCSAAVGAHCCLVVCAATGFLKKQRSELTPDAIATLFPNLPKYITKKIIWKEKDGEEVFETSNKNLRTMVKDAVTFPMERN